MESDSSECWFRLTWPASMQSKGRQICSDWARTFKTRRYETNWAWSRSVSFESGQRLHTATRHLYICVCGWIHADRMYPADLWAQNYAPALRSADISCFGSTFDVAVAGAAAWKTYEARSTARHAAFNNGKRLLNSRLQLEADHSYEEYGGGPIRCYLRRRHSSQRWSEEKGCKHLPDFSDLFQKIETAIFCARSLDLKF